MGWTILHWIAHDGRKDIVETLADAGANVNARDDSGATPLHRAVEMAAPGSIAVLLSHGADMRVADGQGRTVLHLAAAIDSLPLLQMVADHPACPELKARARNGETALMVAERSGHTDNVEFLRRRGQQ
jgi:ankyrin repeat protein